MGRYLILWGFVFYRELGISPRGSTVIWFIRNSLHVANDYRVGCSHPFTNNFKSRHDLNDKKYTIYVYLENE